MKKLLWLVPVALLVVNCGGGGGSLMPLTVGNEWEYQAITEIDFVDTMFTDVVDTSSTVMEIAGETTLDDSTEVFEMIMTMTTMDTIVTVDTSYILDNGDYVFEYDSKSDTDPDTAIAYPLEEGKTWNVNADETAVILGRENVTVPAGTYNDCWEIGYIYDDDTTHVFLAEGTGQVLMAFDEADSTMTMSTTVELTEVNLQ